MTNYPEGFADKLVNQVVGVKHRTEDGHIAVIDRVNSNHPSLDIGLFVNYKNTARHEWIEAKELYRRLEAGEWEVWEDGQ